MATTVLKPGELAPEAAAGRLAAWDRVGRYGVGGVLGVLAGGALADRWGFRLMYAAAAALGLLAVLCARKVQRLEQASA